MRRDPPGTDGPYGPVDGPPIRVFVDEGAARRMLKRATPRC